MNDRRNALSAKHQFEGPIDDIHLADAVRGIVNISIADVERLDGSPLDSGSGPAGTCAKRQRVRGGAEESGHTDPEREISLDYRQDVVLRVTVKGTLEVPSLMPKDELEQWLATESGKASLARMEIQEWDEVATIHASKKATSRR